MKFTGNKKRRRGCRAGKKVQENKKRHLRVTSLQSKEAQDNLAGFKENCAGAPVIVEVQGAQPCDPVDTDLDLPSFSSGTVINQETDIEVVDLVSDDELEATPPPPPPPPPIEILDTRTAKKVRYHRDIPRRVLLEFAKCHPGEVPPAVATWCNESYTSLNFE